MRNVPTRSGAAMLILLAALMGSVLLLANLLKIDQNAFFHMHDYTKEQQERVLSKDILDGYLKSIPADYTQAVRNISDNKTDNSYFLTENKKIIISNNTIHVTALLIDQNSCLPFHLYAKNSPFFKTVPTELQTLSSSLQKEKVSLNRFYQSKTSSNYERLPQGSLDAVAKKDAIIYGESQIHTPTRIINTINSSEKISICEYINLFVEKNSASININTATKEILEVLFADKENFLDELLDNRENGIFTNLQNLSDIKNIEKKFKIKIEESSQQWLLAIRIQQNQEAPGYHYYYLNLEKKLTQKLRQ